MQSGIRPKAVFVKPARDYHIYLEFDNGEKRLFDVAPYIKGDWFGELKRPEAFRAVRIAGLSVEWPDGQDICPDCLYEQSRPFVE